VCLRGTSFKVKVWQALLAIPPGRLSTYGEIARKIGTPGAIAGEPAGNGRSLRGKRRESPRERTFPDLLEAAFAEYAVVREDVEGVWSENLRNPSP
jgi:hypothetical protein